MGLFDEVRCKYPLLAPKVQSELFQSKDTPSQYLDLYEIREDGTLWHDAYDLRIEDDDSSPMGIRMHRDNPRWKQVLYEGELEIHHCVGTAPDGTWYSFRFWFRNGIVKDMIPNVSKLGESAE